ncbi:zinc dependent phospholipase C family protein [Streptomyces sp. NPDC008137]|uniref:zinc dependent phospholipase C family protein n=1 Tax=Streptomyces sp. NPDC008137 TaxID=3364813 RepID=UPI0036EF8F5E
MPGWYIHMEAARLAAERLEAADVPAELSLDPTEAQRLGGLAHKWRNYLALGSIAPDLFYLLPDFKTRHGGPLFGVAEWVLDVWNTVEEQFLGPWEKWMGPVGANDEQLAAQLTGGLSRQIAQAIDLASDAIGNAMLTVPTRLCDVFGQLSSGPPQGLTEPAFYWSDMVHYRRTYDLPRVLLRRGKDAEAAARTDSERADAETVQAFALGWASHCATDVVGHAFTNAKSGGPFRLHWQRHHLVENHFDSLAYDSRFGAGTHYRTLGTSALHFRVSWRRRDDAPYQGRQDAPAYDYFTGFPSYDLGRDPAEEFARRRHFSMAAGQLPEHLVRAITETFREVYADPASDDITPKVLETWAPEFSDQGRPNERALQVMWEIAHRYLSHMSSAGLSLSPPRPPTEINDHPFPSPPGSLAVGDEGRGSDLSDDSVTALDLFLAVIAWLLFLKQVVEWLVTVLPGLILDVATYPARVMLHYTVIGPLYSLYVASRRLLVMSGFLAPETFEIDPGLVTLGRGSTFWRASLRADLADGAGFAPLPTGSDEPSGRPSRSDARHADPAYPRDTPRDPVPVLSQLLAAAGAPPMPPGTGGDQEFSEWVFPWRYPERDVQGHRLGWEADLVHAGPFTLGEDATALLARQPTDTQVAAEYEAASDPADTEEVSRRRLPQDRHLGHPVDYSLYLISRFAAGDHVPSFNLDSDRGYAWRCWDWSRHTPSRDAAGVPWWDCLPFDEGAFAMQQPCTPPAQFDGYWARPHQPAWPVPLRSDHSFDPAQRRLCGYLDHKGGNGSCGDRIPDAGIPQDQRDRAQGLPPEGEG